MLSSSQLPPAVENLLARALPDIKTQLLPKWTAHHIIIVSDADDEIRAALLPRRQVLMFVRDMLHKLSAEHRAQFKTAMLAGHAPALVRALCPLLSGETQPHAEEVALVFIKLADAESSQLAMSQRARC